jgi:hypothetical protein
VVAFLNSRNTNHEKDKNQLEKAYTGTMAINGNLYIIDWLGFYYQESNSSLDANISSSLFGSINNNLV